MPAQMAWLQTYFLNGFITSIISRAFGKVLWHTKWCMKVLCGPSCGPAVWGYLYLVDKESTDYRLVDHMDLQFQDCTTNTVNFCCYIERNIYMCVCVYVFCIMILFRLTSAFTCHKLDWYSLPNILVWSPSMSTSWPYSYKTKICIEGL